MFIWFSGFELLIRLERTMGLMLCLPHAEKCTQLTTFIYHPIMKNHYMFQKVKSLYKEQIIE
jgi:hypothetical protein